MNGFVDGFGVILVEFALGSGLLEELLSFDDHGYDCVVGYGLDPGVSSEAELSQPVANMQVVIADCCTVRELSIWKV